jgi:hypothetical protein
VPSLAAWFFVAIAASSTPRMCGEPTPAGRAPQRARPAYGPSYAGTAAASASGSTRIEGVAANASTSPRAAMMAVARKPRA